MEPAVSPDGNLWRVGIRRSLTAPINPLNACHSRSVTPPSATPRSRAMDLFIFFKQGKGLGTPVHLGAEVNSPGSDRGARLSPDGKTLYFSNDRLLPVRFPRTKQTTLADLESAEAYDNGLSNIWQVSLEPWLAKK
jgi:WD40-like Beta Propeller Repeat